MADKAFIDTAHRLQELYTIASKEPFPLNTDYFELLTDDELIQGEVVFGKSAYCK